MRRPDQKRFDLPTLLIFGLAVVLLILLTGWQIFRIDTTSELADAVQAGKTARVKQLLDQGADINARDDRTPGLFAWLLFGNKSRPVGFKIGTTPLISAVSAQNLEMTRLLLDRGAAINKLDQVGQTALSVAIDGGFTPGSINPKGNASPNLNLIQLLLEHGADADPRDMSGQTLLSKCVQTGNAKVIRLLLSHGANVHLANTDGGTALHSAASSVQIEIARILLAHGADPNAKDLQGDTPLHYAALWGRGPQTAAMVQLLLEHGARPTIADKLGATPLKCAQNAKQPAVVAVLQKAIAKR